MTDPARPADPIEHVVVLMLENRSFDHLLGSLQEVYPDMDGIPPGGGTRFDADSKTGTKYYQLPNNERTLDPSPEHEFPDVMRQIQNGMSGFVDDYATVANSRPELYPAVMGYYPRGFLPVIHTLAEAFAICDHWYCSLPGPTWPNRFFVHSGTCSGHVTMPEGFYHPELPSLQQCQDTIYNRLEARGISWGIFHHGLPQALVMQKLWALPQHFRLIQEFYNACQNAPETLPQYCFLEPAYRGTDENDQHPPADVMNGEALIARVYNALRGNAALWNKTLLIVLHDEHGGFYDHVVPPNNAIPPDGLTSEFSFTQYGPRVPALLISPYVKKGVIHTIFDHTSILSYLTQKWGLDFLTKRVAAANSIAVGLDLASPPRTDTPASLQPPVTTPVPQASPSVNAHEQDLISFARFLDATQDLGGGAQGVAQRMQTEYGSLNGKIAVAKERFALFLQRGNGLPRSTPNTEEPALNTA